MDVFINDQFVPEERASLGVSDLSIQRGYAAFDFLRTRNHYPLFIDDHLDRFFASAEIMFIQSPYNRQKVKEIIFELIDRNGIADSGIRLLLTGGFSPDSYAIAPANFIIIQQSLKLPDNKVFEPGGKVITYEYLRDLPSAKSINYLMGVWLQQKAKSANADDVLYHQDGIISELPRANIWMVSDQDVLVTPSKNILHGITRMKLIDLAGADMEVQQRDIPVEEIMASAEVFLTSTTRRLFPITAIDGKIIGTGKAGPITKSLLDKFLKMEEKILSASKEYMK